MDTKQLMKGTFDQLESAVHKPPFAFGKVLELDPCPKNNVPRSVDSKIINQEFIPLNESIVELKSQNIGQLLCFLLE